MTDELTRYRETVLSDKDKLLGLFAVIGLSEPSDVAPGQLAELERMGREEARPLAELFVALKVVADHLAEVIAERDAKLQQLEEKEAIITAQTETILELSTPVIRLEKGVVVAPLIGAIDTVRAHGFLQHLLQSVAAEQARCAIIDITGVPTVDSAVAAYLTQAMKALRLLGTECILTGVAPEVAQTMVRLGIPLTDFLTRGTLQQGLVLARRLVAG